MVKLANAQKQAVRHKLATVWQSHGAPLKKCSPFTTPTTLRVQGSFTEELSGFRVNRRDLYL